MNFPHRVQPRNRIVEPRSYDDEYRLTCAPHNRYSSSTGSTFCVVASASHIVLGSSNDSRIQSCGMATSNEQGERLDVFRNSPLRYAGYANEVGESFRYQFPKLVFPSYVIAFGYCCADAAVKGWTNYNDPVQKASSSTRLWNTAIVTADTLLWQSLASVLVPGATINAIVKVSRLAVRRSPVTLHAAVAEWLLTGMGLASIPFIVHPIDNAVDLLLDGTTRSWWRNEERNKTE